MRKHALPAFLGVLVLLAAALLGVALTRPQATSPATDRAAKLTAAPLTATTAGARGAVRHPVRPTATRRPVHRPVHRPAATHGPTVAPVRPVATTPAPPTIGPAPTTAPAAPAPAAPTVHGTKKGVSAWSFSGVDHALADSGVSWFYDWSSDRSGMAAPGVEFVPMIWGAKSVTTATLAQARSEGSTLLGFNEPDFASQSNLTADQALALWPKLMATGMRLGSPAPATGAATPGGWLDRFMAGAAARGYRVDFITLHWYGSDFSANAVGQLRDYIQAVYQRYHKPIWLTEYALMGFAGGGTQYPTAAQQTAFVRGSTAMLAALPYVERYAWFALPAAAGTTSTGLYGPGGVPNSSGLAYRAAS